MGKQTSTLTKFSIVADMPADLSDDATTGYPSLTYVEVGEAVDLGEYGPNVQVVESNPLATGITEKFKGFINYGSQSIQLDWDIANAGQELLEAGTTGADKDTVHAVKIEYGDGRVEYYGCQIFSYTRNPGSANQMVGSTVQVEINTPVISVAPAA